MTPPWRQGPAQILPMGDRGVGASPGPRGEPPVPLPPQPSPTGLTDEEEVETVVVAAGGTPKTAGPAVGDPPAPTARSAQTRSRSCKIPRRDVPSRADSADARTRRAVSADARAGWHESPRPAPATPPFPPAQKAGPVRVEVPSSSGDAAVYDTVARRGVPPGAAPTAAGAAAATAAATDSDDDVWFAGNLPCT